MILVAILFGVPFLWLLLRVSKWSAPVAGVIGLAILSVGVTSQSVSALKFGAGLFVFSSVLFVLGGGMKGR